MSTTTVQVFSSGGRTYASIDDLISWMRSYQVACAETDEDVAVKVIGEMIKVLKENT